MVEAKRRYNGDEAKVIDPADRAVRVSQSAGGVKDLAKIQRGGDTWRMFTMFYSYVRVEGEDPECRWPTAFAEGPRETLSPLARPGKAIALEAQIELWPAIMAPSGFSVSRDCTTL